jgi:hypothetical protein
VYAPDAEEPTMVARDEERWKNLRSYVAWVIERAGSDVSVGKFLGLADGSRVGLWRKGKGRPSELMCIKIARWQGDDPLRVLRLAGYDEMADLLKGIAPEVAGSNVHQVQLLQSQLNTLKSMIDMALQQTTVMTSTERK